MIHLRRLGQVFVGYDDQGNPVYGEGPAAPTGNETLDANGNPVTYGPSGPTPEQQAVMNQAAIDKAAADAAAAQKQSDQNTQSASKNYGPVNNKPVYVPYPGSQQASMYPPTLPSTTSTGTMLAIGVVGIGIVLFALAAKR